VVADQYELDVDQNVVILITMYGGRMMSLFHNKCAASAAKCCLGGCGKGTTSLVIIQFEPSADFQELLSGKMFYFFKL
jgi:acyl-CoA hydrolase